MSKKPFGLSLKVKFDGQEAYTHYSLKVAGVYHNKACIVPIAIPTGEPDTYELILYSDKYDVIFGSTVLKYKWKPDCMRPVRKKEEYGKRLFGCFATAEVVPYGMFPSFSSYFSTLYLFKPNEELLDLKWYPNVTSLEEVNKIERVEAKMWTKSAIKITSELYGVVYSIMKMTFDKNALNSVGFYDEDYMWFSWKQIVEEEGVAGYVLVRAVAEYCEKVRGSEYNFTIPEIEFEDLLLEFYWCRDLIMVIDDKDMLEKIFWDCMFGISK